MAKGLAIKSRNIVSDTSSSQDTLPKWHVKGELVLNCNCTVFCPCVISLGKHLPTEGFCQAWAAIRIDDGMYDTTDLSGLKTALLIDIPSYMARGNWTAGLFVDNNASDDAYDSLVKIFSGAAKGTSGLLSLLVSTFLGAQRANIDYINDGDKRIVNVDKKIQGEIVPIEGTKKDTPVIVNNSGYWIAPDITIGKANKGKVMAFGRVWDFANRSAEICDIHWSGPEISR